MIRRIITGLGFRKTDEHMREVLMGTLLAFVLKVGGSALAFAFNVILARLLGAEGTGIYFLSLSITTIAVVVGSVGLNNTLLRFVATHAAHNEWQQVNAIHALGIRVAILAAGTLSLVGFASAAWIADSVFGKNALAEPLRWMSLTILPVTLFNLYAQSLKGLKRLKDAMFIQGVGVPLVSLMLIWPLAGSYDVLGAVWAYAVAATLMAVIGIVAWRRATAPHASNTARYEFGVIWRSSKPLLIASLASEAILPYLPLFLLGVWSSSDELGIYGVASRVAALTSFLLVTINHVIAPKFAELYAKKDIAQLAVIARKSAALTTLLATPVLGLLIFAGSWVMGIFGQEFVQGWDVLAALAIGQAINLATGSVGYLLMMTGNEHAFRNLTIMSSLLLAVLSLLLIPPLSGLGAAISTAIAVAALNIGAVIVVRQRIGIWCIAGFGSSPARSSE